MAVASPFAAAFSYQLRAVTASSGALPRSYSQARLAIAFASPDPAALSDQLPGHGVVPRHALAIVVEVAKIPGWRSGGERPKFFLPLARLALALAQMRRHDTVTRPMKLRRGARAS